MAQKPGELAPTSRQDTTTAGMDGHPDNASPDAIRAQIEETREEMAETLDTLQGKLDPRYLKNRALDQIHAATIGKIEPRLEDAELRVQQTLTAMSERAASVVEGASTRTQQIAAQVRDRAEGTVQAATGRIESAAGTIRPQGARTGYGAAAAGAAAGVRRRSETAILFLRANAWRPQSPARALARGVRTYPVTASLLALGIGLAVGQAMLRGQCAAGEQQDMAGFVAIPPEEALVAVEPAPRDVPRASA